MCVLYYVNDVCFIFFNLTLYLGFLKIGYVIWFRFMVERGNIKKEKYFIFSYV